MTQQTGKLGLLKAECAVFGTVVAHTSFSRQELKAVKATWSFSKREQEMISHLCHLTATYLQLCTLSWERPVPKRGGSEAFKCNHPFTEVYFQYVLLSPRPFVPCWVGGVTWWALSVHLFDAVSLNSTLWRASSYMSIRPPFQSICHIPGAKLAIIQSTATTTSILK